MTSESENQQRQRELYGEPLADITSRITEALGLTQARLAEVLGLSAPMLSQLVSGHRVKIGNPAVLARLHALNELAAEADRLPKSQIADRLEAIKDTAPTISSTLRSADAEIVIRLRRAAPAEELHRLASLTTAPDLAELLSKAATSHG